ncbi:MAG TPA: hypothetical protein VGP31_07520 [Planosporangium sp.]|nr:hypothetical protein [Planosporangium sp.]
MDSSDALLTAMAAAPVVLVVTTTGDGRIVFRNDAANAMARRVVEAQGPQALDVMRGGDDRGGPGRQAAAEISGRADGLRNLVIEDKKTIENQKT